MTAVGTRGYMGTTRSRSGAPRRGNKNAYVRREKEGKRDSATWGEMCESSGGCACGARVRRKRERECILIQILSEGTYLQVFLELFATEDEEDRQAGVRSTLPACVCGEIRATFPNTDRDWVIVCEVAQIDQTDEDWREQADAWEDRRRDGLILGW